MGMLKEFKEFAMRGNVIDMAVGIVIGGAFGKIVSSLVSDIIMPPIGLLGNLPFKEWQWVLREAADPKENIAINVGTFLDNVFNFLIVAFAIFFVIKQINRLSSMMYRTPSAEPTKKTCTFCQTEIPIKATRCPHCTSELPT